MTFCSYKTKYFDYDKNIPNEFKCTESASIDGLCVFHGKTLHEKEILNRLKEKIETQSNNEPLFCIGFKIPNLNFFDSISAPVYFTRSTFTKADFSGAKFKKIDFSGANFQNVNFSDVKFEIADFLGAKFTNTADFSNSEFEIRVNFSESSFNDVSFKKSKLNKAQFIGTRFKDVDFSLARIENSDFFGAVFENEVLFVGADLNITRFPQADFQNKAVFTGAKLYKTNFLQCSFKLLNFDHANFKVGVLQGISFEGSTNFSSSYLEKVDFFKPIFKKNANFSESKLKEVSFSEGKIEGKGEFMKTQFNDNVKFLNFEINESDFTKAQFQGKIWFNDVRFVNQNKVVFDVDDLATVSFKNTDMTKVRFGENVKWGGKDGFTIIDESRLEESSDSVALENTIVIYRNLRKNYENRLRYEEADKFFKKEIELTKKYYKNQKKHPLEEKEILEKNLQELNEQCQRLKNQVNRIEKIKK